MVDPYFQQVQAVEESETISRLDLMVGFLKAIQNFAPKLNIEPPWIQLIKHFFGYIGNEVAEVVYS